jgi:hypothetical protein
MFNSKKKGKNDSYDDDYIDRINPTCVLIPKDSKKFLINEINDLQEAIYSDLEENHKMMDILLNKAFDFKQLADPMFSF